MMTKKRGRPRKKNPAIEAGYTKRPSAFDLKRFGITPDPNKAYRWSTPERVNEHKFTDGYQLYQAKGDETHDESGNVRTKGNMVLMERPMETEKQSQARKIVRTAHQKASVRENRREDFERLSSIHGIDLHKHFLDHLEKREDERE
jgi:hypothetical protein